MSGVGRTPSPPLAGTLVLRGDVTVDSASRVATVTGLGPTSFEPVAGPVFFGSNVTGPAEPFFMTPAESTAILNEFTPALQGVVPASGGGTTNFLRADGTWAAPPGGGGGVDVLEDGITILSSAAEIDFRDSLTSAMSPTVTDEGSGRVSVRFDWGGMSITENGVGGFVQGIDFIDGTGTTVDTASLPADEVSVQINVTDVPLTSLADQADDTGLRNVSGSPNPPTADALGDWVDGVTLSYNTTDHHFESNGVSWADSGGSHGFAPSFALSDTSTVQHVPASTGVVGNTFNLALEVADGGITNAKLDDGDLTGQVKVWSGSAWVDTFLTWSSVLSAGNVSGANSPQINIGQSLRLDTAGTGSFTVSGQIIASASMRIAAVTDITIAASDDLLLESVLLDVDATTIDIDATTIDLDCTDYDLFATDTATIAAADLMTIQSSDNSIVFVPNSIGFITCAGQLLLEERTSYNSVVSGYATYAAIPDGATSKPSYIDDGDVKKDLVTHTSHDWVPYFLEEDFTVVHTVNISDSSGGENRRILHADLNWTISEDPSNRGVLEEIEIPGQHPGGLRMRTAGVATSDYVVLHRGVDRDSTPYRYADIDSMTFVLSHSHTSSMRWECGLARLSTGDKVGVYFDTNVSGSLRFITSAGGSDNSTVIDASPGAVEQRVITMKQPSNEVWECYLDGVLEATHSTNVPPDNTHTNLAVVLLQRSGAQRNLELDKISVRARTGSRPNFTA